MWRLRSYFLCRQWRRTLRPFFHGWYFQSHYTLRRTSMNVLDFILWVFNSLTGLNFQILSLSELRTQAASFTTWSNFLDVSFIMSTVIYLSVFYFVWKVCYQLFFRFFMYVIHFPKRWKNKWKKYYVLSL